MAIDVPAQRLEIATSSCSVFPARMRRWRRSLCGALSERLRSSAPRCEWQKAKISSRNGLCASSSRSFAVLDGGYSRRSKRRTLRAPAGALAASVSAVLPPIHPPIDAVRVRGSGGDRRRGPGDGCGSDHCGAAYASCCKQELTRARFVDGGGLSFHASLPYMLTLGVRLLHHGGRGEPLGV